MKLKLKQKHCKKIDQQRMLASTILNVLLRIDRRNRELITYTFFQWKTPAMLETLEFHLFQPNILEN
jgi:hypothetical protein